MVCLKSTESLLHISIKHVLLVSTKIKQRLCVSCELIVDPSPQITYGRREPSAKNWRESAFSKWWLFSKQQVKLKVLGKIEEISLEFNGRVSTPGSNCWVASFSILQIPVAWHLQAFKYFRKSRIRHSDSGACPKASVKEVYTWEGSRISVDVFLTCVPEVPEYCIGEECWNAGFVIF